MAEKSDALKSYMRDVGAYELITTAEEIRLGHLIQKGDEGAIDAMVCANLRLVVTIANDFINWGMPLLDLISEGNIGLMIAARKFDPNRKARFGSHASWWINNSISRAVYDKSRIIRVPQETAKKINKIQKAKTELTRELGREPTFLEIADRSNFSEFLVSRMVSSSSKTVSIDAVSEETQPNELIACCGIPHPDEALIDSEDSGLLSKNIRRMNSAIDTLTDKEKIVVKMRYGLDGNDPSGLVTVSKHIEKSYEHVRQVQILALRKMKDVLVTL